MFEWASRHQSQKDSDRSGYFILKYSQGCFIIYFRCWQSFAESEAIKTKKNPIPTFYGKFLDQMSFRFQRCKTKYCETSQEACESSSFRLCKWDGWWFLDFLDRSYLTKESLFARLGVAGACGCSHLAGNLLIKSSSVFPFIDPGMNWFIDMNENLVELHLSKNQFNATKLFVSGDTLKKIL